MATDNDIKKDWAGAYSESYDYWANALNEMRLDVAFEAGDQWHPADAAYLRNQGREAMVFNKVRRVVKALTGHERKTRLSMRCKPWEGKGDDLVSKQMTALMMWATMAANGHEIHSAAFEHGPVKTGLNLMYLWMDYGYDMINGDFKIDRLPYNRFLLDPAWTDVALETCQYLLRREYLTADQLRKVLPQNRHRAVAKMRPKGWDMKFPHFRPTHDLRGGDKFRYDEFWVRTQKPYKLLIDPQARQTAVWNGNAERLNFFMGQHPHIQVIQGHRDSVELRILVDEEVMYRGPAPQGIDEYPFIAEVGYHTPEAKTAEHRLQGVVRSIRDPQTEINKRRSKMLDILDSQITSGWEAYENTIINPQSLYEAGQAHVVWKNKSAREFPPERLSPPDIPPGIFQLNEVFEKDIIDVPGLNTEMFGQPADEKIEIAGMLAKLRQGAGLQIFQDLWDNHREAKRHLGRKEMLMFQANWKPQKVARILGEQPAPQFFEKEFTRYDCVPGEGILTDTQQEMYYTQILSMKMNGAPIPWNEIIAASTIVDKERLMAAVEAAEKQQAAAGQQQAALMDLQKAMVQAKMAADIAKSKENLTQAQENRTNATLDRVRALKVLEEMDTKQLATLAQIYKSLEAPPPAPAAAGSGTPTPGPAPGGSGRPPVHPLPQGAS